MRRTRILIVGTTLLATGAGAFIHCGSFTGTDAPGGGASDGSAGGDGSAVADGGGASTVDASGSGTTRFCDTLTPKPVFCTDFDDEPAAFPPPGLVPSGNNNAGTVALFDAAAYSGAYSYLSQVQATTGVAELVGRAAPLTTIAANATATKVHLRARFRLDALTFHDGEYSFFTVGIPGDRNPPVFYMVLNGDATKTMDLWLGPQNSPDGGPVNLKCNIQVPPATWTELDLVYDLATRDYTLTQGTGNRCTGNLAAQPYILTTGPWALGMVLGYDYGGSSVPPPALVDNVSISLE